MPQHLVSATLCRSPFPPMKPILSACAAALLLVPAPPLHAALRISEFMADNASGLTDADGDHPDWLEIENTGPAAASLDGWAPSHPDRSRFVAPTARRVHENVT